MKKPAGHGVSIGHGVGVPPVGVGVGVKVAQVVLSRHAA